MSLKGLCLSYQTKENQTEILKGFFSQAIPHWLPHFHSASRSPDPTPSIAHRTNSLNSPIDDGNAIAPGGRALHHRKHPVGGNLLVRAVGYCGSESFQRVSH